MKKNILSIFLLIFFVLIKSVHGQIEITHNLIGDDDTLKIKATEITKVDYKIKIAINYHLLFLNHHFSNKIKKNSLIWVTIDMPCVRYKDSLNNLHHFSCDFSKFKNSDFDPVYSFGIRVVDRKSRWNYGYLNYKKVYYYKYDGWDVFFITELPIEFENDKNIKTVQLPIPKNDKSKEYEMSVYEISNYNVIQIVKNLIHGVGNDYNEAGTPYLSQTCLNLIFLNKKKVRKIKSLIDYPH